MLLVVDDNPSSLFMLGRMLREMDFSDVVTTSSVAQARMYLGFDSGATAVEVLLLAQVMPEVDGLSFLQEVRAKAHLQDLSIIIITALAGAEELVRAFEAGATDYLTKPPLPGVLSARVKNAQRLTLTMRAGRTREQELFHMAMELDHANRHLEELSLTDNLTGLANRRAFKLVLEREQARAQREGGVLGVLMVDVDHFKRYNDHYGHPAGDVCLAQVGGALQALGAA